MNFVAEPSDMDFGEVEDEGEAQHDIPTHNDNLDLSDTISARTSTVKRGRKQFATPRLVAALDNAKVSDGMAIHILIAAAEALGHDVDQLVINRSSLNRQRKLFRAEKSQNIQEEFFRNVI